jgi:hypothetical protein
MSRRIDIEITSITGSTATWRAAGARQPKGVLNVSLLSTGFTVGGTYRAEIEQDMESIEVLSVAPPKAASPMDPRNERLSILVPEQKGPDVQVIYAPKGRGRRDDDRSDRGSRSERPRSGGPRERKSTDGPARGARGARPGGERTSSDRGPSDRPSSDRPSNDRTRSPRPSSDHSSERSSERGSSRPTDRRSPRGAGARPAGPAQPPVTTTFRNALLASLSAEQLPVAEQLLRGGMPSVRQAVAEQNRNAEAQGRPTINAEVIDRIAEELLGKTNLAFWKDRAAGAIGAGKELRLRDLRAVVTSSKTVSLDDEARVQHKELQGALNARVEALRTEWTAKLERALENNDVLEALRLTIRTPEPTTRVSSEAAAKIVAMTSAALTAESNPVTWKEIVNTAVESPVRRLIKPVGIPADPECNALAVKNAGSIPEFAKLLGMRVPPPPPPTKPARPVRRTPSPRRS